MNYENAGMNRAFMGFIKGINRKWLHNYVQLFLRFSGFFLFLLIAYFHFVFQRISPENNTVLVWMGGYFLYLLALEILRYAHVKFYDEYWFVQLRILANIAMLSWLLHAAPLARDFLSFAYLVPYISTVVYFPRSVPRLVGVYLLTVAGLFIGSYLLDQQTPLSLVQFTAISIFLGVLSFIFQQTYSRFLAYPEGISGFIRQLNASSNIADIVNKILDGLKELFGIESAVVLIVDPQKKHYIWHKASGLSISSLGSIELILEESFPRQENSSPEAKASIPDKEKLAGFISPLPPSYLIEPISARDRSLIGLIMIGGTKKDQFDSLTIRFFHQFCTEISPVVENNLLYRRAMLSRLTTSEPVAEKLLNAGNEENIYAILVNNAVTQVSTARGSVFHLYDEKMKMLFPRAGIETSPSGELALWKCSAEDSTQVHRSVMRVGQGVAGHALQLGEVINVPDARHHPWFEKWGSDDALVSLVCSPVRRPNDGAFIGTLSVYSDQENAFTNEDESRITWLAAQGGVSIERERNFQEWRYQGGPLKSIFESVLGIKYEKGELSVCSQLAAIARQILPFEIVRIRIIDNITNELVTRAVSGVPEEDRKRLLGHHLPLKYLQPFLVSDYLVERSYLIPAEAPGWKEFAAKYLYVPDQKQKKPAGWDQFDAFFTPLTSEKGNLLGYIAWDMPKDNIRPNQRIIEAVGAFAGMASWSIDLSRAYNRINEQHNLIDSFISSFTDRLATTCDMNVIGEVAIKFGCELVGAEDGSLFVVEDSQLRLAHSTYLKGTSYINRRKPIVASPKCGLTGWVAATQQPQLFNSKAEYQLHPGWGGDNQNVQYLKRKSCDSLLLVPILRSGRCLGVLNFENKLKKDDVVGFSEEDKDRALHLAEGIGLSMTLVEQFKNVKDWEREIVETDLHELKNLFQFGIAGPVDTAIYWFNEGDKARTRDSLEFLMLHASTFLDELYTLHHTFQEEYSHFPNLRKALELAIDNIRKGNLFWNQVNRPYISIECPSRLKLPPVLQYVYIRIAYEAIMNAIKHSGILSDPGITIKVIVKRYASSVTMTIKDNGKGIEELKPGYGIKRLYAMIAKIKRIGYDIKLELFTSLGQGMEMKVTTYLKEEECNG